MTDSMNFGPEWLRNLSSEGTTTGIGSGGARCQLADFRYGREEMLALYEKNLPPPTSLTSFPPLYSEQVLPPLALVPATEEERQWAGRAPPLGPPIRGRGAQGAGERGGRIARVGRGAYQPYGHGRTIGSHSGGGYDGIAAGWGVSPEQTEWSPRKDFAYGRSISSGGAGGGGSIDNWRRSNRSSVEEDGWRNSTGAAAGVHGRGGGGAPGEKWVRSSSWREGDDDQQVREKRWHESSAGGTGNHRRLWDERDEHLPEWAFENSAEGGGTFDSTGAFHGSDEENGPDRGTELQKSSSQQNVRSQHAPLVTSKSAISLSTNKESKQDVKAEKKSEFDEVTKERKKDKPSKDLRHDPFFAKPDAENSVQLPPTPATSLPSNSPHAPVNPNAHVRSNNPMTDPPGSGRGVEEDFDKLQEDFVSKLVVDEEPPKSASLPPVSLPPVGLSNGMPAPPPNIMPTPPPLQEKWFYQDPQGDLQGPFLSNEMAEWFKAGYFTTTLFVRRQCDERFFTLGELVTLCNGNPFVTALPIGPLKQEKPPAPPPPPALNDTEMALHFQQQQQHQQLLQAQLLHARTFGQAESWNNIPGMQREMFPPQPMMPPPDLMPPNTTNNPLLHHMLHQFKLPAPAMPAVPPAVLDEPQLDPLRALVQQMGGLQTLQNRIPNLTNISQQPPQMKHEPSLSSMTSLHGLPNGIVSAANIPHTPKGADASMHPVANKLDADFIQFMQQHAALNKVPPLLPQQAQLDLDSLWKRNQFQQAQQQPTQPPPSSVNNITSIQSTPQWPQTDKPISMWDSSAVQSVAGLQQVLQAGMPPKLQPVNQVPESPVHETNEKKAKKDEKKQRELEEKLAKKEAEERRKQDQRKQEIEKKQLEEKRKKEEERIRKELEKSKREAEEKRLRELAEKKRLKEQRKEEEAKKKAVEELKKQEDERDRLAAKERDEQKKQQLELQRQIAVAQAQANQKPSKAAPWSAPMSNQGLSLAEIQKLERERRSEQLLIQQQQQKQLQQMLMEQQQQQQQLASPEKSNAIGVQLNWANKPMRQNHVKSLAEIQAEEQDRMQKQKEKEKAAQKEKETLSPPTSTIWSGQSLTWSNSEASFWDDQVPPPMPPPPQPKQKPVQQQQPKQNANKPPAQPQQQAAKQKQASKQQKEHANNNANSLNSAEPNSSDEFTNWCINTLANMNTQVDIPTFVSFLRDIESALDVRDYCREYLGDKPATQQFAAQFLEKRRSFKPKQNAHKDDMCSPAPAITPSTQHSNNDFQEVKGKGKKCKKSKMLKVDARILGFNVTAAEDRINVGERDYF